MQGTVGSLDRMYVSSHYHVVLQFIGPKWNFGSSTETTNGTGVGVPINVEFIDSNPTAATTVGSPTGDVETTPSSSAATGGVVDNGSPAASTSSSGSVMLGFSALVTLGLSSLL